MKCYFCLTEPDDANSIYLDMLYVSLKSARKNTSLDLYVLYDGSEDGRCYSILKEFNVKIIKHKFSHKDYLKKTFPENYIMKLCGHKVSYEKIAGTFMRFDIPFVEKEDDFVFYSDIDVIFLKDFSHENFDKPKYLAASSECDKNLNNISYFNAGIMYLNVKNMRKISSKVFNMLKNGVRNKSGVFDQGYLNQLCFDKMTIMPIEYNWKPYWGIGKNVHIVHLHAMKPGGTSKNSGFTMNDTILYEMLKGHFEDIEGYVYYLILYYKLLGKDGSKWLSSFISLIYTTTVNVLSGNVESVIYYRKYRKYRKIYKVSLLIIIFLLLFICYNLGV